MLSEQIKRVIINIRHITMVQHYLNRIASELSARAIVHDVSKYMSDEFEDFVKLNEADRVYGYGSTAYKAAVATNNAVTLHLSRNSHHPEFHPGGAAGMKLLDLIEMVADWKAASQVYGVTSFEKSLQSSIERFGLSAEQIYVVRLIAEALE